MSLRDALSGIAESRDPEPKPVASKPQTAKKRPAKDVAVPTRTTGKSSNPEYEPVKIYIRKATRKDAERKWEDTEGGDLSDLIQHLLSEYLRT